MQCLGTHTASVTARHCRDVARAVWPTPTYRKARQMTHATDIVAYTFQGDTLCPTCVVRAMTPQGFNSVSSTPVEAMLSMLADAAGIDRMDERSFDSGDFPKVVFSSQVESAEHCGACGELID